MADTLATVVNFKEAEAISKSGKESATVMGTLSEKIGGVISKCELGKKAINCMMSALNMSALQQMQESTFQAVLNSDKVGTQLYSYVSEYAKTSALGRADISKGVTSFLTVTRDINQVENLIKMTERLYAKNPSLGAEGAVSALNGALAGDTEALSSGYGIGGLSSESLSSGDTVGNIELINGALNEFGATQALVDDNFSTLPTQIALFKDNIMTALADQANPTMQNLAQIMMNINENMQEGKYQPFFNLMINGMNIIGNSIAWIGENAEWLIPIMAGVVAGIIAYNIATAVAAVVTMALEGRWCGIAAMAVSVGAAIGGMALAMKDVENRSSKVGQNLADAKNQLKSSLPSTQMNTPLPTEITNTDPLPVTGEVDIEKENLKYLMDMAGQKFFAQYSHNTVVPQNQTTVYVEKSADANEVIGILERSLTQALQISPQGAYA